MIPIFSSVQFDIFYSRPLTKFFYYSLSTFLDLLIISACITIIVSFEFPFHCIIIVMKCPISLSDLLYLLFPLYMSFTMIFGIKLFALLIQNCKQFTWPTIMSAIILVLAVTDLSYPAPSAPPATCPTSLNASVAAAATAATDAAKSTSCSFRVAQAAIVVAACM